MHLIKFNKYNHFSQIWGNIKVKSFYKKLFKVIIYLMKITYSLIKINVLLVIVHLKVQKITLHVFSFISVDMIKIFQI